MIYVQYITMLGRTLLLKNFCDFPVDVDRAFAVGTMQVQASISCGE